IFDAVEKRCPDAFYPTGPVWSLLGGNSEDYVYTNVAEEKMDEDKPAPLHVAERKIAGDKASPLRIRDFITYNLDICKFDRVVIVAWERSDLLLAFYESIEATTILDPTCGAGAFLFAALRILYPLYEACLIRMSALVDEQDQFAVHLGPQERHQTDQIE